MKNYKVREECNGQCLRDIDQTKCVIQERFSSAYDKNVRFGVSLCLSLSLSLSIRTCVRVRAYVRLSLSLYVRACACARTSLSLCPLIT